MTPFDVILNYVEDSLVSGGISDKDLYPEAQTYLPTKVSFAV